MKTNKQIERRKNKIFLTAMTKKSFFKAAWIAKNFYNSYASFRLLEG
jgi:hypothetical protein